ncbi:MAG: HesB/IscA family protein [Leptospirillum sp.]|jgi:iron-sulfur cluster assembly protein|nr:iron-sulfur cluster assembly accessory protein [Nitrospiraceae bacterium]MDA8149526.1 iron-sulfur cluster assembly accessory protein [Nitrospiraceae bacterium]
MISVTDKAADEVLKLAKTQKAEGKFLRLGIEGGGCSGMSYLIRFEEEPGEFDNVMEGPKGIKMLIDPKSQVYLDGSVLDYQGNGLMGGGFKFQNPNATHSCGCGTSFAV